jgi:hypothetical protein
MRSLRLRSLSFRVVAIISLLINYRSLVDVLDALDACKMNSIRKRDRFFRFLKRGTLEREVQRCGADVRRSMETFKVCTPIHRFILSILTALVGYAFS